MNANNKKIKHNVKKKKNNNLNFLCLHVLHQRIHKMNNIITNNIISTHTSHKETILQITIDSDDSDSISDIDIEHDNNIKSSQNTQKNKQSCDNKNIKIHQDEWIIL